MQEAMDRIARYFAAEYADYADDIPDLLDLAAELGDPVLELGCGAGRALVPLAEEGHRVTGVDVSAGMLSIARTRAHRSGVADLVTLIQGDFARTPLGGPFSFAYCVMNTFLHLLTTEEQVRALRHWSRHLKPDGVLLLDVLFPDVDELGRLDGKLEWQSTWTDETTGNTVMKFVTRTADLAHQVIHVNALYDETGPDGFLRRTVAPFDLRYLWRYEAELLLDRAGYKLEAVYGGWGQADFDAASQQMILLARRRK